MAWFVQRFMTGQEKEILEHTRDGMRICDIASAMGLTDNQVKNRTHKIFNRLGCDNRLQAVVWAIDRGLISGIWRHHACNTRNGYHHAQ